MMATGYQLSSPCELSRCDTFLSHSWHDDKEQKWAALQRWCQTFEQRQGRAAQLWFDKVCINQSNIAEDLECLPIFLAGCNGMLVLSGRTYTTRLWCVLEVFIYISMRDEGEQQVPDIVCLGRTDAELDVVRRCWISFDALQCGCVRADDKRHIRS